MALCEAPTTMIALNCGTWTGLGVTVLLLGPILLAAGSYWRLRSLLEKSDLTFVVFKPLSLKHVRHSFRMARGQAGMCLASYNIISNLKERGEWQYDPFGRAEMWAFLIEEYRGTIWVFAIWKLTKKLVFTCVLALSDGPSNAGLAIMVQSLDTLAVLSSRPHISRDQDIIECLSSILNLLTALWLGTAVILKDLLPAVFQEEFALWLSMSSTILAAVMAILPPIISALEFVSNFANLFDFLGVARDGMAMLMAQLCMKSERYLTEHLEKKYMRNVEQEKRSVRLQVMFRASMQSINEPVPLPVGGLWQAVAGFLRLGSPQAERKVIYIRQALAFVCDVKATSVEIELKAGPPFSEWNLVQGAFRQDEEPGETHDCNHVAVPIMGQAMEGEQKGDHRHSRYHHESVDETTQVDVLVSLGTKEAALRAISRLTDSNISASLEAHRVHLPAYIISTAMLQHEFPAKPQFSLHPPSLFVASSTLQSRARRRLKQAIYNSDITHHRQALKEDSLVFDAEAQNLYAKPDLQVLELAGASACSNQAAVQARPKDEKDLKLKSVRSIVGIGGPSFQRRQDTFGPGLTATVTRNGDIRLNSTFVSAADMEERLYSPRNMHHMNLFEGDQNRPDYKEPTPRVAPCLSGTGKGSEREKLVQKFDEDNISQGGRCDASSVGSRESRFDERSATHVAAAAKYLSISLHLFHIPLPCADMSERPFPPLDHLSFQRVQSSCIHFTM